MSLWAIGRSKLQAPARGSGLGLRGPPAPCSWAPAPCAAARSPRLLPAPPRPLRPATPIPSPLLPERLLLSKGGPEPFGSEELAYSLPQLGRGKAQGRCGLISALRQGQSASLHPCPFTRPNHGTTGLIQEASLPGFFPKDPSANPRSWTLSLLPRNPCLAGQSRGGLF